MITFKKYVQLVETHQAFEKKNQNDPNDSTNLAVYADWLEDNAPHTVNPEVLDRLRNSHGQNLHIGRNQDGHVIVGHTHYPSEHGYPPMEFHSDLNNHIRLFVRDPNSPNKQLGWVVYYRPAQDPDNNQWYWMQDLSVSGSTPDDQPVRRPKGIDVLGENEQSFHGLPIGPQVSTRLNATHKPITKQD